MKNKIFLSIAAFFLLSINLALAAPVIENVSISPSYLWLGEDATVSLNCFDNANKSISYVYADITGPGVILPRMFFVPSGGKYVLLVNKIYLDRIGAFDTKIYCENNNSETTSHSTSFSVSRLTGYINIISPTPTYVGGIIEIDFVVEKDGARLSSGVTFDVKFDDISKSLLVSPAYDTTKGWVLKLNSPTVSDIYDVKVTAFYDRTGVADTKSLQVDDYVQFKIVSLSKQWVSPNEEVVVVLKALEGGSVITLDENNLDIRVASTKAEIKSINFHDNVFDVKIVTPSISSGKHSLEALLSHGGYTYSDNKEIAYVVPIEGKIVDENGKGLNVEIKFIKDGVAKLGLITDAFGAYSRSLPPDTYDIEVRFPSSKIYIYNAIINSFNDAIKYLYSDTASVSGIRTASLHYFGISLTYSSVDIEMKYNEKNVDDETELRVFKCSNWNSGKKLCNGDWDEVLADIDVVKNLAEVTSSGLSAFVIGTIEGLNLDFNSDKKVYNPYEIITVNGLVKDKLGKSVGNAFIDLEIKNTNIYSTVRADSNGVFSVTLPAPEKEGNYTLSLTAELYPYTDFVGEKSFVISKSKSVYINFPDSIKVERGGQYRQSFSLVNTGQDELDIKIVLDGIPKNYYILSSEKTVLREDEEETFHIDFSIPEYAETGIFSANLVVSDEEIREEKVFGFTVADPEKESEETESPTGLFTGLEFPSFTFDLVYVLLIVAIVMVFILIINKKRFVGGRRDSVKNFLSSVKDQLKRTAIKIDMVVVEAVNYNDLISSEFPEALKKLNRGGKYGKDN